MPAEVRTYQRVVTDVLKLVSRLLELLVVGDSRAEALEFIVNKQSKYIGEPLKNLRLRLNLRVYLQTDPLVVAQRKAGFRTAAVNAVVAADGHIPRL